MPYPTFLEQVQLDAINFQLERNKEIELASI